MNVKRLKAMKKVVDRAMGEFPFLNKEKLMESLVYFSLCLYDEVLDLDWERILNYDDNTFGGYIGLIYNKDIDFGDNDTYCAC